MHFAMDVKGQIIVTCTGSHVTMISQLKYTCYKKGKNMATCAGSPQIAIRVHGSNKCPTHHGKEVTFLCKNCNKLVCADCVIGECEGHVFGGISQVIPAAKEKIQKFITNVELTEIPNIQGKIQEADNELDRNEKHFKHQISKIRKQNEALKKELDKITETFVKTCQGMEQQNSDELLSYKNDLQTRIDKLTSQIQEYKGTLQSGSDILVFDTSHVIPSELDDLPKPVCSTHTDFTPRKLALPELEQLLGKINNTFQNKSFKFPGNWNMTSKFRTNIPPGHKVWSLHATGDDQAWLCFYNPITHENSKKMLLTDKIGHEKQTLEMDVLVNDFCLPPNTGNIWFCSDEDNSIREVEGGKSTVRFTTDTVPLCLCMTKDDHVIIGHSDQVVKYTQGGQVVCRTSVGDIPLVKTPCSLSECPLTSQLAVVDLDRKKQEGNDKPSVLILNDQLEPLYTYTGEVQQQRFPPKPFDPVDVCYTRTGELVIADCNNKSVVLVTGTGTYLQTLYNSQSSPTAVSVHNGVIWVLQSDENIQVLIINVTIKLYMKQ